MKDIAKLANTSLGTVDRALNNKPGVSKNTKNNILEIAKSLNYSTNKHGKALVIKQQNIKLGVILEPQQNPYFQELKKGIQKACDELQAYGITTHIFSMNVYSESEQLQLMDQLRSYEVSGIAMNAINSAAVSHKIDEFVAAGIKIVTCNTDNDSSQRSCFVGFENETSGRVAAELLAKFAGGIGSFLIIIGLPYIMAHNDRQRGFIDKISETFPNVHIVSIIESKETDEIAFEQTLLAFEQNPEINGIYVAGFGVGGVAKALKVKHPKHKVHVLCHDYTPLTDTLVREDIVDAIICQDAVNHGYSALKILSELIIDNKEPQHKAYMTSLDIRLKENINTNNQNWEL